MKPLLGLALLALGLFLMLRPLTALPVLSWYLVASLALAGLAELGATPGNPRKRPPRVLLGSLWLLAAAFTLFWLGHDVGLLLPALALLMLVAGLLRLASALWPRRRHQHEEDQKPVPRWHERLAGALFGSAEIVLGLCALILPDVSLVLVAFLFGVRTLLFGLSLILTPVFVCWSARRGPSKNNAATTRPAWLQVSSALAAVVLATATTLVAFRFSAAGPELDDFYTPPATVPATAGQLISSEPFTRGVPSTARAWRILYTTTLDQGQPTVASGIVVVPGKQPASAPVNVIAWAHGTTGFARACAPSALDQPFESGAMMVLPRILEQGWALVATDYPGLGTAGVQPYLVGQGQGRAVLDATRAAQQLKDAMLANNVSIWGHSQGGHAALWAGQLAREYAPDLHINGVAALSAASDPIALTQHLPEVTGGSVFASFVAAAYAGTYPDVRLDDYIVPSARTLVREMSGRCLSSPGTLASVLTALSINRDRSIFSEDPTTGAMGARLAANKPAGTVNVPLFLGQGGADPLVTPALQRGYAASRCAQGQPLEYHEYPGLDHMGLVNDGSPLYKDLLAFTAARFAGDQWTGACSSVPAG